MELARNGVVTRLFVLSLCLPSMSCNPFAPNNNVDLSVTFQGASAAERFSYGYAEAYRNGEQLFLVINRGFNVLAINPVTGEPLEPTKVRSFDTYITRSSGQDMRAMIAYLNSLPDHTIIFIGVVDDAGLTLDSFTCLPDTTPESVCCKPFVFQWTEDGKRALEQLGATMIRNYCFRNSWGMVTVKGEGKRMSSCTFAPQSHFPTHCISNRME